MKKIFSLLIVALMATTSLFADDISAEQALQIANKFAANPGTQKLSKRRAPIADVAPELAYQMTSKVAAEKANVYIVNLGNDQGFVLVSGESGTGDNILGYCDHGSFAYDDCPVQLKDLLTFYTEAIDSLRQSPMLAVPRRAALQWPSYIGAIIVGPLLTTTWSQEAPYNYQCPESTVTGCVPTAIAQVMNYWKWPKESIGKLWDGFNFEGADFSGHVYDWDNMLDNYGQSKNQIGTWAENTPYNQTQADAVAKLMADIGKAFGTSYGQPNGSPTSFWSEPLVKNFSYEPGIEIVSAPSAAELVNALKSELDKNRPVLYSGNPMGEGDGHALVVDGYTSNDYFHFNYGWGGYCDGFYKSALVRMYHKDAQIFTNVRPYDAVHKVIDDIDYALMKNGEAHIFNYTKDHVKDVVLEIPATVTGDDGKTYRVTHIRQSAFYQKGHFSKLVMGDNIESIDAFTFFYTNIDELVLSDKMEVVPVQAFLNTKVKKLTIGKNIKRIDKRAFYMCDLTEVTSKSPAFEVGEEAFAITHPGPGDWFGCITSLGKRAFSGAIFSRNDFNEIPYFAKVEKIDDEAFFGATMPNSRFKIPPTLRYISPKAFSGAVAVSSIGRDNIKGFEVDENNPYFSGDGVFIYNKNQTSLVLTGGERSPIGIREPDGFTMFPFAETMVRMEPGSISSRGGKGPSYDAVTIPATVVEMEGAFKNCETLSDLTCLAVVPPVITDSTFNDKIFENSPEATLHVPEDTEELYATAPGWRKFPNIVGDQEYDPAPLIGREYYMVVHQNGQDLQDVRMPVKDVTNISMDEAADGQTSLVVKRSGMDNLKTNIMYVDSITWTPGFVFEDGEVFDINDSTLTVKAQKCEVTLGKTVIDGPAQMRIRNSVLTPRVVEDIVRGQAVDVALLTDTGEVHNLSGVARIAIPIQLNSDEKVQAAYYNTETGEWDPVLFKYDEEKGAAVILTDHLSLYSVFAVKNDSTRGTILSVYDEFAIHYQNLNKSLETLFDIVSSDEPEQQAIMKWKSDVGFWQTIGIDGGYNLISGLGFESEFLGECVNVVGYLGTASTVLDVIGDAIQGDNIGVASNTLKTILGFATGQMASAIGTGIMSASMGVAAFIGVALEKLGTTAHELKKAQLNQAYRYYYTPEGQGAVGNQSVYKGLAYRSPRDWFDYFYPAFEKAKTHDRLMMLIEQAVHMYTERFWDETTDAFTYCMDAVGQRPFFGSTYPYPDEQTRKEISDDYYAELMNNVLPEVFSSIKEKLETKAAKDYHKRQKDYVTVMNTAVAVFLKDSEWEEGKRSKYAGWKVRFTDLPEYIKDKEKWECVLDDKGCGEIGYFSAYSLIKNQMRCNLTLLNTDDEEESTYDFTVPHAKGKVHCDVDLADGGVEVEAPHLNLELAYDPAVVEWEVSVGYENNQFYEGGFYGMYWDESVPLDNSLNKKARFQKELERFFNQHNFITVDESGNYKIGDDISGVFAYNGLTATGKFTINVSNDFIEQTPEQFVSHFNTKKKHLYELVLTGFLLNGTIQYQIECEYTITRASVDSKEYDVTYKGTGTYALLADVVSRVTGYDIDPLLYGDGKTPVEQAVAVENLITKEITTDGTVTLKYSTKLK